MCSSLSSSIFIRKLDSADIPTVVALAKNTMPYAWSEAIFQDCFKENYYAFGLIKKNNIVGFVIILIQLDECQLFNIAIRSDQKRKGYAKKLINYIVQFIKEKKANKIILEVRESNQAAIKFYQSMGFKKTGVRKNYYPIENGREDALLFERLLCV